MRFLAEVRCEKLRPEIFRLTERLDYQDPSAIIATQSRSPKVAQAGLQVGERLSLTISRAGVWLRAALTRRRAARWAAPTLPPILMAFFGETRRNSTAFQQIRVGGAGGGPGGGGSAGGWIRRRRIRRCRISWRGISRRRIRWEWIRWRQRHRRGNGNGGGNGAGNGNGNGGGNGGGNGNGNGGSNGH